MSGNREAHCGASIPSVDHSQPLTVYNARAIRASWLKHELIAVLHLSVDAVFPPGRSALYATELKQTVAAGASFSLRRAGPVLNLRLHPLDALDLGQ